MLLVIMRYVVEAAFNVAGNEPVMNPDEADADAAPMLAKANTATAAMPMCFTRFNLLLPTYVVCMVGEFSRLSLECVSRLSN